MDQHRTRRVRLHSPAFATLAALPLVLSTSSGVLLPSGGDPEEPAPPPSMMAEAAEAAAALAPVSELQRAVTAPAARRASVVDVRAGDIPWSALQAYKRASDILGEVEQSCELSWTLLAAVGQVSSRHGQVGDSELGADAVARPDIVAPAARKASERVADTDAGDLDGDPTEDRAVGPMQLQPAVWSVAGVDGDGDGRRSPHDVDDAALATAVFLCATGEHLGEEDGAAAALRGLNQSRVYVEQVLAVEAAYRHGDFAVADPPALQSIGKLLDTGASAPARAETERAVRRVTDQARPAHRRDVEKPAAKKAEDETARTTTRPAPAPAKQPADDPVEEPADPPAPAAEPEPDPAPGDTTGDTTGAPAEQPADEQEQPPAEQEQEQPPADDEQPPAEEPAEPETVVVEGTWVLCEDTYCLQVVSEETGEPVLLPLDLELFAKSDEEQAAMVDQVLSLVVVQGTEPLVVVDVLPPETSESATDG